MNRTDLAWRAGLAAAQVIREQGIVALPVDPVAVAGAVGIEVRPMPAETGGVSGMLLRAGNTFGIAYATHIESQGFRNFSIAHELGHYFLEGHIDAVLATGDRHESHAGFGSDDRYELEADHFAASLLMPESLFAMAISEAGQGLAAIEQLAARCVTSLTATAIRYAQCTGDVVAVVVSAGRRVKYCFMSDALQELAGNNRISKNDLLPPGTVTAEFNKDPDRVRRAERTAGTSDLQDWIGGPYGVELAEEVVGLGGYGKTLTVLMATSAVDPDELQDDEDLIESWRPRFRR
ncbi:MAG: ImmA/IrrE family metallo-endopeptidase [Vicinamibacteraceae bacterium]